MKIKSAYVAIVALSIIIVASSCQKKTSSTFTFAFYNIENLFDTINSENVNDESYLPSSMVAWNTERFNHKLDNLSRVIKNIDTTGYPALIGICEVENKDVVEKLIAHPELIQANYNIIHKDSPDKRGIDVALLYNPKTYLPIKNSFINPDLWNKTDSTINEVFTRDILYSKGLINNSDTIHVFINHWVSRWGGQEQTEPHRIQIAKTIKKITDSILNIIPQANIIITGDLNDNPTDISIFNELKAKEATANPHEKTLYNLGLRTFNEGTGSLYYNSWDMFDQIIVSTAMLSGKNGLKVGSLDQEVVSHDWMLYHPKKGPARPSRTASGGRYYGGFSDHLPVKIQIIAD